MFMVYFARNIVTVVVSVEKSAWNIRGKVFSDVSDAAYVVVFLVFFDQEF